MIHTSPRPWYKSKRFLIGFSFFVFILGGITCLILLALVHPALAEDVVKNSSYSISKLSLSPVSTKSASISITGEFNAGRTGDITFTKPVVFSVDQVDVGSVELDPINVENDKGAVDDQDKTLDIANSTALGGLVHKILTDKEVEVTGTSVVTVYVIGISRAGIGMTSPFKINGADNFASSTATASVTNTNITVTLTLQNPSSLSLSLTSISFDLSYNSAVISSLNSTSPVSISANSPTTVSLAGNLASGAAADDFKAKLAGGSVPAVLTTTSGVADGKGADWVNAGVTGINIAVTISKK
ncbi:6250_t:CDS:2 [Paraglomus brasilianum]|uniref:6250_t:CDS:1 n=1 Tax=Paraglomus brasilianum TaxID=144538 RepID=A0A9N9G7M9_9GLOM|nr:6250_t:CDS:2 [Paraglomus brasilianum]